MLPDFFYEVDVHRHLPAAAPRDGIVNIEPDADGLLTLAAAPAGALFSAGIHPWKADSADDSAYNILDSMAAAGQLVAIGECGLDRRRGPDMAIQMPVFRRQALMAEEYGLPLIIHAVGAYSDIPGLHKSMQPRVPWIIHGFRGKPETARQLAARGIYLSLNPEHTSRQRLIDAGIPARLLLRETDAQ